MIWAASRLRAPGRPRLLGITAPAINRSTPCLADAIRVSSLGDVVAGMWPYKHVEVESVGLALVKIQGVLN